LKRRKKQMMNFYDTSSLLLCTKEELNTPFLISSITLSELEYIKSSNKKTEEVRAAARNILCLLEGNSNCEIVSF
jgi:hypothetical protein